MPPVVVGVDGGTTGIRAGVFTLTGVPLAFADVPYATSHPAPGRAEQVPASWLDGLATAIAEARRLCGVDARDVAAVCVDTTCCSVVALDARGDAIGNSVLWMDVRASDEATACVETEDDALRVNCAGAGPVSAEWMVPKALWLKRNDRERYDRATMICEYQDYVNLWLTGRYCGSMNNVGVRWHFDGDGRPPMTMLEKLGCAELVEKWPKEILPMGAAVGGMTATAAAACGLLEGTKVIQGGADAFVGMVGLGVIEPGQLALITGSSHLHLGVAEEEFHAKGIFGTYRNALVESAPFVVEGGQTSTGSVVNWFKNLCGGGDSFYDDMNREASAIPPGCEGVVALDHFQGNRTPHVDALSRGVISGLTLKHSKAHVFRAILEGVCCGTRLIFETMTRGGYEPKEVVIAGGATRSELWLQIHADVTGVPHVVTECSDAPALGCAILAAFGAGLFGSVREAVAAMVRKSRVISPNPEAHAAYADVYAAYLRLYPSFRETWGARRAPAVSTTIRAIVCPSLLAADQGALASEVNRMLDEGADWLHVDIMDGHFVPNLTIGPPVVADLAKRVGPRDAFFDCHLSVSNPATLVPALAAAGASSVTFHIEVVSGTAAEELCKTIRSLGMRAAVACKPSTPCDEDGGVYELVDAGLVDMVLCLSVEPGFGGQKFNPAVCDKVSALRARYPDLDIQMDGGVNPSTAELCARAGANVLVAGSAVFGAANPAQVISQLRQSILNAS